MWLCCPPPNTRGVQITPPPIITLQHIRPTTRRPIRKYTNIRPHIQPVNKHNFLNFYAHLCKYLPNHWWALPQLQLFRTPAYNGVHWVWVYVCVCVNGWGIFTPLYRRPMNRHDFWWLIDFSLSFNMVAQKVQPKKRPKNLPPLTPLHSMTLCWNRSFVW
jgi:hypothetical protein